jgi:hypothetical protein
MTLGKLSKLFSNLSFFICLKKRKRVGENKRIIYSAWGKLPQAEHF